MAATKKQPVYFPLGRFPKAELLEVLNSLLAAQRDGCKAAFLYEACTHHEDGDETFETIARGLPEMPKACEGDGVDFIEEGHVKPIQEQIARVIEAMEEAID